MSKKRTGADIARTETRRSEVAKRLLAGHTYRQIAADLGVAMGTIQEDVRVVRQQWREEHAQTYEEVVDEARKRLNALIAALWNKAQAGDANATEVIAKIQAQLAKMLGLDAPAKVQVTGAAGGPLAVEATVAVDLAKLSDEELAALRGLVEKST